MIGGGFVRKLSAKSKQGQELPNLVFEFQYSFPISFLSFSQRRFVGFRNKTEFDKKRVLFSSKQEFVIIGYDYEKRVYELLRSSVSLEEEIKFISFLEDHNPSFVFVITYNSREIKSYIKILKLKKNKKHDNL